MRTAAASLAFVLLLLAGCSDAGESPDGPGDGPADGGQGGGDGTSSSMPSTGGSVPAPSATPCTPRTHEVVMRNNLFVPADLTVCQGDTVHWTTEDVQPHNVVSTSGPAQFRSEDISIVPGAYAQDYSYTFTASGTVDYLCEYHSGMVGTITVTAA